MASYCIKLQGRVVEPAGLGREDLLEMQIAVSPYAPRRTPVRALINRYAERSQVGTSLSFFSLISGYLGLSHAVCGFGSTRYKDVSN